MGYCNIEQIVAAFPPVLTAIGVQSFDVATTQVNCYHIPAAASVIDSYIAKRYTTPVTPAPFFLTKINVDLVLYELFRERAFKIPDFFQTRYDQAMQMLKDIADGDAQIPGATETTTGDNFAYSTALGYHPVFSPVLDPLDQSVDQDFVQSELDVRASDFEAGVNSL